MWASIFFCFILCGGCSTSKNGAKQTATHKRAKCSFHLACIWVSIPFYFFSFRSLHKADLHQLQQPCNLMDKGSYQNSGFVLWQKTQQQRNKKDAMKSCAAGDHRSVAHRWELVRREYKKGRCEQKRRSKQIPEQGYLLCQPHKKT